MEWDKIIIIGGGGRGVEGLPESTVTGILFFSFLVSLTSLDEEAPVVANKDSLREAEKL